MINIFSVLLVGCILILMFVYRNNATKLYCNLLAMDIFFSIHVYIGYFIRIESFDIDYIYFLDIVLLFFTLFVIIKQRIHQTHWWILFIGSTLIGLVDLMIFPPDVMTVTSFSSSWDNYLRGYGSLARPQITGGNLIAFTKLFAISVNISCAFKILKEDNWNYVLSKVTKFCKIVVVYAYIETVCTNFFGISTLNFATAIFGVSYSTNDVVSQRGIFNTIQGLTREPSHFAFALFITSIIFFISDLQQIEIKIWFFLTSLLEIICGAFSGVLYLVLILILLYLFSNNDVYQKIRGILKSVILCTLLLFILFFFILLESEVFSGQLLYWKQRFREVISIFFMALNGNWKNYSGYFGSTVIRIISTIEILKLIVYRPIFGFGISTVSSHSSFAAMIVNMGTVGIYLWYRWIAKISNVGKKIFTKVAIYFVFALLIASVGNNFLYGSQCIIMAWLAKKLDSCMQNSQENIS